MNSSKGNIVWKSKTVLLGKRVYLFCIGNKCMSGKVTGIKQLDNADKFEIVVDFIQPDYFANELIRGSSFTINEASKILGNGKWKDI
jgi:hypothetical protein